MLQVGRFEVDGRVEIGEVKGDRIRIIRDVDDLPSLLATLDNDIGYTGEEIDASEARQLAPIDPRARVFAVALNYRKHAEEAGNSLPERPLIFYKAPTCFVGQSGVLNPHQDLTKKFDYEGEVGVVIGKRCSHMPREEALSAVAGICAFMDGSARDLGRLRAGDSYMMDWMASKCLDNASTLGPTVMCGPEVLEGLRQQTLTVETRLNQEVVQRGEISDMVFSTEELIATLSSFMTLLPGDVIATGTPSGVGMSRNRFLQSGDELQIDIPGFSSLSVTVG